jgi:hypothetical protein
MARSDDQPAEPPRWQYVALEDYQPPAAPVSEAARTRLAWLWALLQRMRGKSEREHSAAKELQALSEAQLAHLVPSPDWCGAAAVLATRLTDWLAQPDPEQPVVLLVGAPYNGHTQILAAWAEQQRWTVLYPPSRAQILDGGAAWLAEQREQHDPWVLPRLEQTYLRHTAGLQCLRGLLDQACTGRMGRGIIGCDSWAWAFLRRCWHGPPPLTLTLQAADEARLRAHLQPATGASEQSGLFFRVNDTEQAVLVPLATAAESVELSNYLQLLAAYSRGILGVAWATWRESLRLGANGHADWPPADQTIWLPAWNEIEHPQLPSDAGHNEAFVLHTLLLHNGLPSEYLRLVLPLLPGQVNEVLFRLKAAGLVSVANDEFQVAARAYPVVRQFLQTKHYLVDHS